METVDNFYVTLPSNSSMEEFPNNSLTNFTSRLAFPIQLSNANWEVGLWEILHPNSWKKDGDVLNLNMADDVNNFALTMTFWKKLEPDANTGDYLYEPHVAHPTYLQYGQVALAFRLDFVDMARMDDGTNWVGRVYAIKIPKIWPTDNNPATLERVLVYLQRTFNRIQSSIFGAFNGEILSIKQEQTAKQRGRVTVKRVKRRDQFKLGPGDAYVDLHIERESRLARLLGFSGKGLMTFTHVTNVAEDLSSRAELDHLVVARKINSLYIYSDVVQAQLIGNEHAKILRVVPVHSDRAQDVTIAQRFSNIQYCKTAKSRFDTIEIDIRDDTGRPVPFDQGRVTAILHFRKT
jgi:hypothetical protein